MCKDEGVAFRWFVCAMTRELFFVGFICVQGRGNCVSFVLYVCKDEGMVFRWFCVCKDKGMAFRLFYVCAICNDKGGCARC